MAFFFWKICVTLLWHRSFRYVNGNFNCRPILRNNIVFIVLKAYCFIVAPVLGMAWYRDPVFRTFVRPSIFATTLRSTLLFVSVS